MQKARKGRVVCLLARGAATSPTLDFSRLGFSIVNSVTGLALARTACTGWQRTVSLRAARRLKAGEPLQGVERLGGWKRYGSGEPDEPRLCLFMFETCQAQWETMNEESLSELPRL